MKKLILISFKLLRICCVCCLFTDTWSEESAKWLCDCGLWTVEWFPVPVCPGVFSRAKFIKDFTDSQQRAIRLLLKTISSIRVLEVYIYVNVRLHSYPQIGTQVKSFIITYKQRKVSKSTKVKTITCKPFFCANIIDSRGLNLVPSALVVYVLQLE